MNITIHAWRDLAHPQAGGSEKLVDQLARGAQERGHSVRLIAGGPVDERPYPVIDAGGTFGQYLRNPLIDRRFRAQTDVVVDVANGMSALAPLWWRGPTVLLVHHVHLEQWGLTFPSPIAAIGRLIEGRLAPRVYRRSVIAAVSPSTAVELRTAGFPDSSIRLLPNPIELPTSNVAKTQTPQFLILGRMVPHKRIDLALRAWQNVRPVTGGQLLIVGDGPERERLEAMAGPDVEFLGKVSEQKKADLLAESWLLLHPAHHEGWGLVITEAAAAGTPTLGFAVPGVRDSVSSGESGVLVADGDEESFVKTWIDLATMPEWRAELSDGARKFSQQFTTDATINAFETILAEAVDAN